MNCLALYAGCLIISPRAVLPGVELTCVVAEIAMIRPTDMLRGLLLEEGGGGGDASLQCVWEGWCPFCNSLGSGGTPRHRALLGTLL